MTTLGEATLDLTFAAAARKMREAVKDKTYRAFPVGEQAGHYMRFKRKRLTDDSYRDYESCLDKLARDHMDLQLADFEPPVGTERLEEFLDNRWGRSAARTYNKNHSILSDFFKWARLKGKLYGDPMLPIERARSRSVYRTTFTDDTRRAIVASQAELRDRLALRLLLDYGLRKGALRTTQLKHFDHQRRRLTIFTKGQVVREVPIPGAAFWLELERHILDTQGHGDHFLLCRRKAIPHLGETVIHLFPMEPMGQHGLHDWWYRCLTAAGVVAEGTTHGERMHKARHTAGQRVLDKTGNLKAVQRLLGHSSIQTTGDLYTDWDIDQLAQTMGDVIGDDDRYENVPHGTS